VAGKRLLHLQCHFGSDTLSWARLGAQVTGADFSEEAIALARRLAGELGIDAEFVCCNIYDLPEHVDGEFDVVFTSEGVLCWLPDLPRWAEIAAGVLGSGGVFYIRDFHPLLSVFDDEATEPRIRHPYFPTQKPMRFEGDETYTDGKLEEAVVTYEWPHSLGDVVTALTDAGLRIEFLHEFPYCTFAALPFLSEGADGLWRYEAAPKAIPLMFSVRARKE
jgi:SAM-dependent methyltransferase